MVPQPVPCPSLASAPRLRSLLLTAAVAATLALPGCASAPQPAEDSVRADVLESRPVRRMTGEVSYLVTFAFEDRAGVSNTVTLELDRQRWMESGAGKGVVCVAPGPDGFRLQRCSF